MTESDVGFEKMLAEYNQAYAESEGRNDWMPPDSEYVVSISKTSKGTMTVSDKPLPWWRLTGTIQEPANPELDGKEFAVGFFTAKAFGILKTAASVLAGHPVGALKEADDVLSKAMGALLKVRVGTTYSKTHKRNFSNCNILQVLGGVEPKV